MKYDEQNRLKSREIKRLQDQISYYKKMTNKRNADDVTKRVADENDETKVKIPSLFIP